MASAVNRIRVTTWLLRAAWRRHAKKICITILACLLIIPTTVVIASLIMRSARSITIGIVGKVAPSDLPYEITSQVSFGLTRLSATGLPEPALAEAWEATDSGKVYTVRIKRGLYWHDKSPVYADNIPLMLPDVTVSYPDSYTIRFVLKEPFSPLLVAVSKPLFKKNNITGLGEYIVQHIALDENGLVRRLILRHTFQPSEHLAYTFYESEKAAVTALKMGEIDILGSYTDLMLPDSQSVRQAFTTSHRKVVALLFNVKDPLFEDKAVRQGLGYLLTPSDSFGEPAFGPILPTSWAYFQDVKQIRGNPDLGNKLLEKKLDSLRKTTITVITPPNGEPLADAIAKSWRKQGLTIEIKTEKGVPQKFQVYLATLDIPGGVDQYSMWHSSQATNVTGYNSKRVDKLLEDARQLYDQEEQKKRYIEFQRYLVEDTPAIFLYYPRYFVYYNRHVSEADVLRLKRGALSWSHQ